VINVSNHLSNAISPYLVEHSQNPVDWYPWTNEALVKAKTENKPIFLSIGYAACHWCHVMAHESFEDPEIAAILNEHYVSIKVDREERPDLDSIYMSAVVALTGQGGWPMSVFLTPDLQPFYGGTYFPPRRRNGLPGFTDVLLSLAAAWKEQRSEVERVSAEIAAHLQEKERSDDLTQTLNGEVLQTASKTLVQTYDWEYGGWGAAPKFPQPMAIDYLIRRHLAGDADVLLPALRALRAMARGGMYDVVGGGFARYSTDPFWRVPHFEKMLYDNALLSRAYLHAWLVSGEALFRDTLEQTIDFIAREMTSPEGGFYSSLDADSEGEEGKFYVWDLAEIRAALGEESLLFETAYGMTAAGNFEGKTVLQRAVDESTVAARFELTPEQVAAKLAECHTRLLAVRDRRVRPRTDDKILTGWNALMLATLAECARFLGAEKYTLMATRNAQFLVSALRPEGKLRHAFRNGKTGNEVFLEDYAALILGLLELYQTDFDPVWFSLARDLAGEMIPAFGDSEDGFFDTPKESNPVLIRPRELQDNATPSGNALAAEALLKLAAFDGNETWRKLGLGALGQIPRLAEKYPTAFARWLSAVDFSLANVKQVAILGKAGDPGVQAFLEALNSSYRPNLVLAAAPFPVPAGAPALFLEKTLIDGKATAYVCESFTCKLPVTKREDLEQQLREK
jgi:uncharacterized protein YyaL (SSP411 family)